MSMSEIFEISQEGTYKETLNCESLSSHRKMMQSELIDININHNFKPSGITTAAGKQATNATNTHMVANMFISPDNTHLI